MFVLTISMQAETIIGKWKTVDDTTGEARAIVEITEHDGKIYGKVIKVLDPTKQDIQCINCSGDDENKLVLGFEILKGLSKDENK